MVSSSSWLELLYYNPPLPEVHGWHRIKVRILRETELLRLLYYSCLGLVCLQLFSLAYYVREQRFLAAYLSRVADPSRPSSEQIKDVVLSLKEMSDANNDSYFLFPMFGFLRPTALQVIQHGGDCADRSRLVVALMRLRGISASKWALYNARGESVHAVVQADVESGNMVVDPLFGIWFPKPRSGGYYSILELRQDPNILSQRITELRAQGLEPGADRLEAYNSKDYIYSYARTINWNKSPIMKYSYGLLSWGMGRRVDELKRPAFAEEPPLMVVYGAGALESILLVLGFVLSRHKRMARQRGIMLEEY
jgi:hypothetical protein